MKLQQKLIPVLVALAMFLPGQVLAQAEFGAGLLEKALQKRRAELGELNFLVLKNSNKPGIPNALSSEVQFAGAAKYGDGKSCDITYCNAYKIVATPDGDGKGMLIGEGGWDVDVQPLSPAEVMILTGQSPDENMLKVAGAAFKDFQAEFNNALGVKGSWNNEPLGKNNPLNPEGPWVNPFAMFYYGGWMLEQTGTAFGEAQKSLDNSAAKAQANSDLSQQLQDNAVFQGIEIIGGTETAVYSTNPGNPPIQMPVADGQEAYLDKGSLYIDTVGFNIVAHRFDGRLIQDGKTRQFFIERINSDFRQVPDCALVEPYHRVMRMGGILVDAQMAEMEEAKKKLAEFDKQVATMSPQERKMMESMVGSQMDMLRNMADGGVMEYVEDIEAVYCDPDLKALYATGNAAQTSPFAGFDLAQIQLDLDTLGYEPGNTDGILDALTQVAISQYQAEHGMAVTGEPSSELASRLAAEVAQ